MSTQVIATTLTQELLVKHTCGCTVLYARPARVIEDPASCACCGHTPDPAGPTVTHLRDALTELKTRQCPVCSHMGW